MLTHLAGSFYLVKEMALFVKTLSIEFRCLRIYNKFSESKAAYLSYETKYGVRQDASKSILCSKTFCREEGEGCMDREQRKKYLLRVWLEILTAGLVYLAVITFTDLRIPCVFHLATGLLCPGCGVTRMVQALVRLDLRGAFASNPFVLCLLPAGIPYGVYRTRKYIEGSGDRYGPLETALLVVTLAGAILFGVIRNLPDGHLPLMIRELLAGMIHSQLFIL